MNGRGWGTEGGRRGLGAAWDVFSRSGECVQFRGECVQFLAECVHFPAECVHFGGAGVQLKYGRSPGFEIRACNGDNRCSAWASLTVPAMAGLLPTIALPKTTIKIGEQISVGANDVPVGAVAYLQLEGPIQPRGRARTRAPQFGDDVGIEEIHALVELRGGTAAEGSTRGCESFGARLGREQQRLEVWLRRWLRLRFGVGVQFPCFGLPVSHSRGRARTATAAGAHVPTLRRPRSTGTRAIQPWAPGRLVGGGMGGAARKGVSLKISCPEVL